MTNFLAILAVTAYCATGNPAANGKMPVKGITCAAPRSIPLGTHLFIDGVGERIVTDRTARRFDGRVDLFYGTNRQAALKWGKRLRKVWIVNAAPR